MSMIWIDALQFKKYGGWRCETQFVREMGQGYLLAVKTPGEPAENCETEFTLEKKNTYRLWVRVKNWIRDHAPGRFYALVDGERIGNELGNLPSGIWTWQIAGDIILEPGTHTLAMNDSTGYFPRFAAVLITDDVDYTPSPEWDRVRRDRALALGQSFDAVCKELFDVVVAGGGPGGIPAAIAAAREGCRVALVHSRPVLGGNASNEAAVGFDGAYIQHPGMRESGIAEEIRRLRDSRQCTWQEALETLCAGTPNLTIFLNQCVIDTETEGGRVRAVITQDTITGLRSVFPAKIFIDATGDGWLGYYAGAAYRVGREARWQHGEEKAPRNADGRTMSGCLMGLDSTRSQMISYFAEDTGSPVSFCAPDWAQILPKKLFRSPRRMVTGEWWIETPTDYDDLFEAEMVRDYQMVLSLAYFHWLKNDYEKRDLVRNYRILCFPSYNAKRESRRLVGDYILRQEDCVSGHVFEDAVAYAGWTIDVHNQDGIFSGLSGPYDFDIQVPVNQIPFRCLYSKNIENLLMAGRCISATHVALGTIRVQNTLAAIGQAVGTAAALCVKLGTTPRELGRLRQRLLRNDAYIPGVFNEDPDDLARKATVNATSQSHTEVYEPKRGIPGGLQSLDETYCAVFSQVPSSGLQLYIKNMGDKASLSARWVEMDNFDVQDTLEKVTRLTVHVLATYGDPNARMFEVRIY
jgi:hypothetical protein